MITIEVNCLGKRTTCETEMMLLIVADGDGNLTTTIQGNFSPVDLLHLIDATEKARKNLEKALMEKYTPEETAADIIRLLGLK